MQELEKVLPAASYDECGSKHVHSKPEKDVAHPEYKTAVARLETFETKLWPIGIRQKPRDLVEAGFFYSGQSDITICFSCGLAIGKWEVTDNPWVEHQVNLGLTKECSYLKSNKDILEDNKKRYQNELQALKAAESTETLPSVSEDSACKVCFAKKSSVIFLPCGHVAVCSSCSLWIEDKCPICRSEIKEKISLYYA